MINDLEDAPDDLLKPYLEEEEYTSEQVINSKEESNSGTGETIIHVLAKEGCLETRFFKLMERYGCERKEETYKTMSAFFVIKNDKFSIVIVMLGMERKIGLVHDPRQYRLTIILLFPLA